MKRGGHRTCFHATMLTNTVIKVTFGDLRAQQISVIIFQCGVLIITTSSTFFDCLFICIPEKCLQIPCIILSLKGHIIWTQSQTIWTCSVGPGMSLSVAFISFTKRVTIDFCQCFSHLLKLLFSLNFVK